MCDQQIQNLPNSCCDFSYAFLSRTNHWGARAAGHRLARDTLSPGCFSLVSLSSQSPKPIIAIVGPTASGKSQLGLEVALRFDGEIVNCDSVQVYREIEIATAKLPVNERRGIPHHLIDFVPPEINYTAGDWARRAEQAIEEIEGRGRTAMLVGGTGFYLRALRQPFFPSPETDQSLRRRLTAIRERRGSAYLHRMLRRIDSQSAVKFSEGDWPRIQRALEVSLQTKKPMSAQSTQRANPPAFETRIRVIALLPPRAELYARINQRTAAHFAAGLVDEVRALLEKGVPADSNALGAHGYRRVVEFLRGERDLEGAIEQTRLDVRHYAKRQLTWFRSEPGVEWFEGFGDDPGVQERIMKAIQDGDYA